MEIYCKVLKLWVKWYILRIDGDKVKMYTINSRTTTKHTHKYQPKQKHRGIVKNMPKVEINGIIKVILICSLFECKNHCLVLYPSKSKKGSLKW